MPNMEPPGSRLAACLAVVVLAALALTLPVDAKAQAKPTPWVVLKCKFADDPTPLGSTPQLDRLLTGFGAGDGGMFDYWRDMSGGRVSLAGSVVRGWFTMSLTRAAAAKLKMPGDRFELVKSCVAAADPSVDFKSFYGIIVATNDLIDSGSNRRVQLWLDGALRTYGIVNLDRSAWTPTFAAHEMGHGYGLDDSFAADGTRHGDPWDIMSALTFGGRFPVFANELLGISGPALSGANRDQLGWIPTSDLRDVSSFGGSALITLSALDGGPPGTRLARFWHGLSPRYEAVELRTPTRWDAAIGRPTVLVHQMRTASPGC